MSYPTRKIGNTPVSAIGFGAMGISAFYGTTDPDEERFKVLDAAFANGCTFWDTANVYGDSEELIGKWFKKTGKRDQIFLATKFGIVRDRPTKNAVDGSAKNVEDSINRSLQRLGVDCVDLYYLHRPDPEVPIEVTVGAMAKLIEQGKVKYLGLSECSANTLRRASKIHPIAAVQLEYSPFELDLEKNDVLKTARELGIKIIAYSPLGRGLLTGRYKSPDDFEQGDFRRFVPRYSKENFPNVLKLVDELQSIGKEYNATAGQVTLAWLLAQGEDVIPIPGTKKIKYLEENLAAAHVALSAEAVQEVRVAAEAAALVGDRYPAQSQSLVYGDTPAL
ncbi:NADP-dependent oxidoreductase domain-containing protein [Chiua virens]|nr:NADP-dependent oxidoreductase domain-containing protein [Chiua virens]